MRLNVFNQVNLQRACGYQAVVVSSCSGAVRLSLRSLLQWRAVTACTCFVLVFCSVLLVFLRHSWRLLLTIVISVAYSSFAGVISQSFISPIECFGFVLWPFARRCGLRARLSLVYGLFAFNYSVLVVLLAVLQFVSFPVALLTSDSIFRLGYGATLAISSAYHRYPSSIGIGLCVAVLRLYPVYSQSIAWCLVLPSALFQGCRPIPPL